MDEEEYNQQIGLFDEEENRNFSENNESNPRFHSDWCSMIFQRLLVARNLLSTDGVIFISISDSELCNLTKICDNVFGEDNQIGKIVANVKNKADKIKDYPVFQDWLSDRELYKK